jgi:drug/metabolite transporter (DMT)-like permease
VAPAALGLALAAAVLHAFGNVLIGGSRDTESTMAVVLTLSVVVFAPFAALTWRVDADAWPWIAASAALEAGYFVLLTLAYRDSEISLVYPIARGSAPVLVLVAGIALGHGTSAGQAAGVVAVGAGVVLVRGIGGEPDVRGVALALATALFIAGYTVVDKEGIRHAAPLPYLELVLIPAALIAVPLVLMRRGRAALQAAVTFQSAAVSITLFVTYLLILVALRLAPAAAVSAVRETSVVFAAGLAAWLLHERVTRWRFAGAALVASGIALLALT